MTVGRGDLVTDVGAGQALSDTTAETVAGVAIGAAGVHAVARVVGAAVVGATGTAVVTGAIVIGAVAVLHEGRKLGAVGFLGKTVIADREHKRRVAGGCKLLVKRDGVQHAALEGERRRAGTLPGGQLGRHHMDAIGALVVRTVPVATACGGGHALGVHVGELVARTEVLRREDGVSMGSTSVRVPSAATMSFAFMLSGFEGICAVTFAGSFSSIVGPKGLSGLFA